MLFDLVILITWLVIGIVNLCGEKIRKSSFAIVWGLLIMYMIFDILEEVK